MTGKRLDALRGWRPWTGRRPARDWTATRQQSWHHPVYERAYEGFLAAPSNRLPLHPPPLGTLAPHPETVLSGRDRQSLLGTRYSPLMRRRDSLEGFPRTSTSPGQSDRQRVTSAPANFRPGSSTVQRSGQAERMGHCSLSAIAAIRCPRAAGWMASQRRGGLAAAGTGESSKSDPAPEARPCRAPRRGRGASSRDCPDGGFLSWAS